MESLPPELVRKLKETANKRKLALDEKILLQAQMFHEGAMRCMENRTFPDGRASLLPVPAIVHHAFACELYLKALFAMETGRTRQGHRLNVLFAGLSSDTKNTLRQHYGARRNAPPEALDTDIAALANGFVEWRYVYEMKTAQLDLHALGHLAASLYEVCVAKKPGFRRGPETHELLTLPVQGLPIFVGPTRQRAPGGG